MRLKQCRRPNRHEDDCLCFCPANAADVKQVLARAFINSWVHEVWYQKARQLVSNADATQADAEALLFSIEESANDCYAMWRQTQ